MSSRPDLAEEERPENSVLLLILGGAAVHRCDNRLDLKTALAAEGSALAH
jgi:hypothetical protein